MSAWEVSDEHLKLLAIWSSTKADECYTIESWERDVNKTAECLKDANVASLLARYGDKYPTQSLEPPKITYEDYNKYIVMDPLLVIKQVHCYEYQSCEHNQWDESAAKKIVNGVRNKAIHRLPGYDDMPWGI
jgi:hypothetical protein